MTPEDVLWLSVAVLCFSVFQTGHSNLIRASAKQEAIAHQKRNGLFFKIVLLCGGMYYVFLQFPKLGGLPIIPKIMYVGDVPLIVGILLLVSMMSLFKTEQISFWKFDTKILDPLYAKYLAKPSKKLLNEIPVFFLPAGSYPGVTTSTNIGRISRFNALAMYTGAFTCCVLLLATEIQTPYLWVWKSCMALLMSLTVHLHSLAQLPWTCWTTYVYECLAFAFALSWLRADSTRLPVYFCLPLFVALAAGAWCHHQTQGAIMEEDRKRTVRSARYQSLYNYPIFYYLLSMISLLPYHCIFGGIYMMVWTAVRIILTVMKKTG